jgi:hypothetical protein
MNEERKKDLKDRVWRHYRGYFLIEPELESEQDAGDDAVAVRDVVRADEQIVEQ